MATLRYAFPALAAMLAITAPSTVAHAVPQASDDCDIRLANIIDPPKFSDYPAPRVKIRPAKPVMKTPEEWRFRTMLRQQSAAGPNFAGHYTVVIWGCGTSCLTPVIVDAKSGRVFFDNQLGIVSTNHVPEQHDGEKLQYEALRFRVDSRMLVVLGASSDADAPDGAAFYEWTGKGLKLIRYVPRPKICEPTA